MSRKHRALVAGAGIAGLAAAAGLHRLGWEVHLVDRRRTFDAIPTGLFFPANGMRAFAALGVAGPLMSRGRVVERMRLRGTGCPADSIAVLADVWPGIGPSVAIHRELALETLRAWCPVALRAGAGIQSLRQRGGRVDVALSDGSAASYDLVVGADGAYSTVRGQLWPDARARYGGESWWRGVVPCPDQLNDWSACLCAAGTFLAMPIGGGLAYWTAGQYTASSFRDPVRGRAARVRDGSATSPVPTPPSSARSQTTRASSSAPQTRRGWTCPYKGGWYSQATPGTQPPRAWPRAARWPPRTRWSWRRNWPPDRTSIRRWPGMPPAGGHGPHTSKKPPRCATS